MLFFKGCGMMKFYNNYYYPPRKSGCVVEYHSENYLICWNSSVFTICEGVNSVLVSCPLCLLRRERFPVCQVVLRGESEVTIKSGRLGARKSVLSGIRWEGDGHIHKEKGLQNNSPRKPKA